MRLEVTVIVVVVVGLRTVEMVTVFVVEEEMVTTSGVTVAYDV